MASVTEDGQGIRVSLNEAETQLLIDHAQQLKEEGYSNQTIAQRMGITEPSVIVLFEKGNN